MTEQSWCDVIRAWAAVDPRCGLHLYEEDEDAPRFVPYVELHARVTAAMEEFRGRGVGRGTRVLFPFEATLDIMVSFFALIGIGALPLSVRPHLPGGSKKSYHEFLDHVASRYRVGHGLDVESLRGWERTLERLPLPTSGLALGCEPEFAPVTPVDLAFIQFSSGSTSLPKGVPITHGKLLAQVGFICRLDQRHADDVGASWLPLYHDMGLVGVLSCLWARHEIHLSSPLQYILDPLGWWQRMAQRRMTITVTPNFGIDYCLKYLREHGSDELRGRDFSPLRAIYVGSEPINIANLFEFAALLAPHGLARSAFKPCYGMAEAVLMVSSVDLGREASVHTLPDGRQQIEAGEPLPEFDLRLRSEDGRILGEGEEGEIEIRGGSLAEGYFEDDRPYFNADGFFPTGDLGCLRGGRLYVTGRINDRFKVNAQSYFAAEFEQAVESLPFIRKGRSVVFQHDARVVILAEVQSFAPLRPGAPHRQQVCDLILERFGIKVQPKDVLFIRRGQIEKTSSGKLRRNVMAERYRQGHIRVATPWGQGVDLTRGLWARLLFRLQQRAPEPLRRGASAASAPKRS